jgi:superfamily II DNA or RNA helicase
VIAKVAAVFESYWNSGDFVPYDASAVRDEARRARRQSGPKMLLSPIELRLEPFQERLLEQIALARSEGHHRNLLVSATGTGKTVMAARRLRAPARPRCRGPGCSSSRTARRSSTRASPRSATRCATRRSASVGRRAAAAPLRARLRLDPEPRRERARHLAPRHFDVVIVDEFHHAAAPSYQALLEHLAPVELLGLTATPERSDGCRCSAMVRRAHRRRAAALGRHRSAPARPLRLLRHPRRPRPARGPLAARPRLRRRGAVEPADRQRRVGAARDLQQLLERLDDARRMRALGFCVSVEHARFMARVFNEARHRRVGRVGRHPDEERARAEGPAERQSTSVFSVDLFNEGVDVPAVDTL